MNRKPKTEAEKNAEALSQDPDRVIGPGEEQDGGESILSGRSREHQSEIPEEVEVPREAVPPKSRD